MSPAENVTGKRIVAALIDIVILGVVFVIFAALFGDTETSKNGSDDGAGFQLNLTGLPFVLYLGVVLVYYIGTEAMRSATPGKLALGLRIASADDTPLSIGRVVVRNVLRIVDGLPFLYLVGIITIAASKRDQRIGDMAAQTIVVPARGATSGATDATGAPPADTDTTRF
jgi:uncharacterized RDD family membrane protein YckC